MQVFSMAYNNFKNNMKTYTMFFISMVFSAIILSNFFILMCGDAVKTLGEYNANYTKMILQMIIVILVIFIFFFIWYTSNIFLKNRKKEIGLYIFMGVDLKTIGSIYFIEMMLIGIFACVVGISLGALFSKFFQMIIFGLAGFNVKVKLDITSGALIRTAIGFMVIFTMMSIKGFISIMRSKVIDLLNDSRKVERMPRINILTYIIAVLSLGAMLYGYYLVKLSTLNVFKTLFLVCIGTYGLFYAFFPVVFRMLIHKKSILYKGENIIAINSLAYRIKKNYTTYATMSLLTACTISALGTAVSLKKLYTMSYENDTLYTASFASEGSIPTKEIAEPFLEVGTKQYELDTTVLRVKSTLDEGEKWQQSDYNVLSYEQFLEILRTNGNQDEIAKVNEKMVEGNKVIYIQRPGTLASLIPTTEVLIYDEPYEVSEGSIRFKTLGSLLNDETLIVNDDVYNRLKTQGETLHFYGIKVDNEQQLLNKEVIEDVVQQVNPYLNDDMKKQIGIYNTESVAYLRVVYAIGTFLFLVFVLAEASIIYTKIYSDAMEDKEKYKILMHIGGSRKELERAIRKEVALFYALPLVIGLIDSFFAIQVLGDFLSENLLGTFMISSVICMGIFIVSYMISVASFKKIVKVI
ncbi:MAG: ABC transporter permease [Cellulosilyticum sp.]|nr:ABC transporter permease [Cellulosilyticum sp.]